MAGVEIDAVHLSLAGPHITVDELIAHIPASAYHPVTVGATTYWCFSLVVRIPTLGRVWLVISFATAALSGTYAVLVTNRREWQAHQIIASYLRRWPTETFYQDGKGHLGLDAYRMRSAEAIGKHWCLVFVAYSFQGLRITFVLLSSARVGGLSTYSCHPIRHATVSAGSFS